MELNIIALSERHKPQVSALIETDELRPEDILAEGTRYWGAFLHDQLVGMIGCEYEGQYGLLRSALVQRAYRGHGIAAQLTQTLLQAAKEMRLKAVYLFSTGAGDYWKRQGFAETTVDEVTRNMPGVYQVRLFSRLGWLPTEVAYRYELKY